MVSQFAVLKQNKFVIWSLFSHHILLSIKYSKLRTLKIVNFKKPRDMSIFVLASRGGSI